MNNSTVSNMLSNLTAHFHAQDTKIGPGEINDISEKIGPGDINNISETLAYVLVGAFCLVVVYLIWDSLAEKMPDTDEGRTTITPSTG